LGMVAVRDFVNPRAYDEHDREMLTAIANQTAIALQNARLFDNLERMVAERTAELQETEMRLSQFVERSLTGIYRTTLEGEIIEANPAMLEMLGYDSIEETNQIGLSNLYVDPAQYEEMLRLIREEGQVAGFEMAMRRKDGEIVQLAATAQLVMNEGGKPAFLEGTIENITRRKQLEAEREQLQQEIIEAQKQALRELSTPIIPIMDRIIVMPLIGSIDTMRARDITRSLLAGIREHRAKIVILDITGVPIVDSGVANYLNKTIQAARLKGASTIITGVSDAVAETIVDLGIDWSGIETVADLQTGLRAALAKMGRRIGE
jgi:rsbT co-antagonist protein RsbR